MLRVACIFVVVNTRIWHNALEALSPYIQNITEMAMQSIGMLHSVITLRFAIDAAINDSLMFSSFTIRIETGTTFPLAIWRFFAPIVTGKSTLLPRMESGEIK